MSTFLGTLRRYFLAPSLTDVSFRARGFPPAEPEAVERLERIPQAVVCGFEWAVEAPALEEIERRLAMVEPELRGFAYEGAAMAFSIVDSMPGGRRDRTAELLSGPGRPHLFLTYIGIGFAMARLPRPLWKAVLPDLPGERYHPTMTWLAVDGYGFDRAYFDTRRWVDEQRVPRPYPWAGAPDYFPRAVDQGIGRALWFIHGARAGDVAVAVERFGPHRWADLWSGVGLAATFAGGCPPDDLAKLRILAGSHAADLALGAVFAVKARDHAGHLPPHTAPALTAVAELSVADAVALADRTEVTADSSDPADPAVPPYELWRRAIRSHFDDK
ncbi:Protein of unknown function [Amycolatopsis arida]|uniref:Enediyne biosynthesis protein n=1 Tax=Amycolatopsis arida TaxID=587909 RepID=A0A1I5MJ30_9PSEU|nr:DUF1702 family protein [Amycolatopsis arida]TDX94112.1 uncharacterized protein DUF1702 [Amycolatopsis arida]SFP09539.1 Protein of unknown function [Amycolatopsis arida]